MFLFGFTLIFSFLFSSILLSLTADVNQAKMEKKLYGHSTFSNTLSKNQVYTTLWETKRREKQTQIDKELVYKVLQRTCNNIYAQSLRLRCPQARNPSTVWTFAGTVGAKGSLLPAWTGSTTNTFSCGSKDAYGRGLIQRAIPVSFIQNRGYRYDFTGMTGAERTYPCGYGELVTK